MLINHVLASLPIHLLVVFYLPKIYLTRMESHVNQFLWGSTDNSKKRVSVSWKQVCNPKEEGGLGVRKLTNVMNAFRMSCLEYC